MPGPEHDPGLGGGGKPRGPTPPPRAPLRPIPDFEPEPDDIPEVRALGKRYNQLVADINALVLEQHEAVGRLEVARDAGDGAAYDVIKDQSALRDKDITRANSDRHNLASRIDSVRTRVRREPGEGIANWTPAVRLEYERRLLEMKTVSEATVKRMTNAELWKQVQFEEAGRNQRNQADIDAANARAAERLAFDWEKEGADQRTNALNARLVAERNAILHGQATQQDAIARFSAALTAAKELPKLNSPYFPGYEPGGPVAQMQKRMGQAFDPEQYRQTPVDPFVLAQQLRSLVPAASADAAPPSAFTAAQDVTAEDMNRALRARAASAVADRGMEAVPSVPAVPYGTGMEAPAPSAYPEPAPARTDATPVQGEGLKATFVRTLLPYAVQAEQASGIPASYLIAMAANETGWDLNNALARHYNYFGIKGVGPTGKSVMMSTGEDFGGPQWQQINARFRSYDDPGQAFQDAAQLNAGAPTNSPAAFAQYLRAKGWATDRNYAGKIVNLIGEVGAYLGQPTRNQPVIAPPPVEQQPPGAPFDEGGAAPFNQAQQPDWQQLGAVPGVLGGF